MGIEQPFRSEEDSPVRGIPDQNFLDRMYAYVKQEILNDMNVKDLKKKHRKSLQAISKTLRMKPPENELQKVGDRILSEHELRVQKSLQKLNVPDWYKNSNVPSSGFILKRHSDAGHSHSFHHWQGLSSKTTSLSSLGSSYSASAAPKSPTGSNRGGLLSPSPTPTPTHVFSRWSTNRLNSGSGLTSTSTSTSPSPCSSARSSFNYRQPYLGWRSQEQLNKPRTPAERLAAGLLPAQRQQVQNAPSLTDVQTSIKEVTAAIVHYVSGRPDACNASPRWNQELSSSPSRSTSPRGSTGRLCWLESSFVGSRPTEVPETPSVSELKSSEMNNKMPEMFLELNNLQIHSPTTNLSHYNQNGRAEEGSAQYIRTSEILKTAISNKPSPNSTTMEDVLDSLLGLPPASRSPSPGSGGNSLRRSCGDLRSPIAGSASHERESANTARCMNENNSSTNLRRVSFDAAVSSHQSSSMPDTLVRCRYTKCNKVADVTEAKKTFKTCHNCAHVYCSRECRRAHWEKHRKTCLHSRVGSLCRQVLSACKEDSKALEHLSLLARRGYLSQGRGAVKNFFSSPEAAEKFVKNGFSYLGEPTFARWSDLLPSEMGADLYSEIIRLCKNYNPETRFVLYVAVCVVSEVPTTGAVKWERQIVSRCAKMRLCRSLVNKNPPSNHPKDTEGAETLILTSLPGNDGSQKARQISFANILRHLRHRGVSLRRSFPEVYKNLCNYVEGTTERFTPVTIYPKDAHSGKTFMCIIMLDSENEQMEMLALDKSKVQTIDVSVEQ